MAASYSAPDLWSLLERIPRDHWPQFLRCDSAFGTDAVMSKAEEKGLPYLFKLKQSTNVKRLIARMMPSNNWSPVGRGWEGQESVLQLAGWKKKRRVVDLRKPVTKDIVALSENTQRGQMEIQFGEVDCKMRLYEYSVLVTSLPDEIVTIYPSHMSFRFSCRLV
ncbi:hypothetical protein BH10PSE19_BH10PSE19_15630 [soil metagenome]